VERFDSGYELRRFQALDSSPLVKTWTKRHGIRIAYKGRGKKGNRKIRHYIPDILVEYHDGRIFLEEVKGYVFDVIEFARKNHAARAYCVRRRISFRLIYKDDLEEVL
jgi:hypothetical protein